MAEVSQKGEGQQGQRPRMEAIQSYGPTSTVRAAIQDADVLLFRGANFVSRLIEVGTDSPYSHAAIVFRSAANDPLQTDYGPGRVCLIEAVGKGIKMGLLSEEVASYNGALELWRLEDEYLGKLSPLKAIAEARRYLGRPYAFWHLLLFAFDWLTLGLLRLRSCSRDRRAFFCSQLVSRAYVKGGVDLNVRYGDAATAPADLVKGRRIRFVHAFSKAERIPL
jgi:hypothetical protein